MDSVEQLIALVRDQERLLAEAMAQLDRACDQRDQALALAESTVAQLKQAQRTAQPFYKQGYGRVL